MPESENNLMIWPERRHVSDALIVLWATDAIENGDCEMNPAPTLAQLQCDVNLARRIVEDAGYATFRGRLRSA